MLTVLAAGDWNESQVGITFDAPPRKIVPDVEAKIDTAWNKLLAKPGVHLFDGPIVRLGSFDASPDHLHLHVGRTSYKPFVGTNMAHPELVDSHGRDVMANPVGVSCLLLSGDGHAIMGHRRSTLAYYPSRVHPFAGSIDPSDAHPFDAVRREMREELSLADAKITDTRCTGVVEDHLLRQAELVFYAQSDLPLDVLAAAVQEEEHHAVWSIAMTPAALGEAIAHEAGLTPVACASLLLWGRLRFGQGWYDASYAVARQR